MTDTAYRYEDKLYSIADEYGEHMYSRTDVILLKFDILRRTPCGIWIREYFRDRFINQKRTKQFAHETLEEAMKSFIARKEKQASIYRARADAALYAVKLARSRHADVYRVAYPISNPEHEGLP